MTEKLKEVKRQKLKNKAARGVKKSNSSEFIHHFSKFTAEETQDSWMF